MKMKSTFVTLSAAFVLTMSLGTSASANYNGEYTTEDGYGVSNVSNSESKAIDGRGFGTNTPLLENTSSVYKGFKGAEYYSQVVNRDRLKVSKYAEGYKGKEKMKFKEFQKYYEDVRAVAKKYNTYPSILMAQIYVNSYYHPVKGNNLFLVQSGKVKKGDLGRLRKEGKLKLKTYKTPRASIEDYAKTTLPKAAKNRKAKAFSGSYRTSDYMLADKNYRAALDSLKTYNSDPLYRARVENTISQFKLTIYDGDENWNLTDNELKAINSPSSSATGYNITLIEGVNIATDKTILFKEFNSTNKSTDAQNKAKRNYYLKNPAAFEEFYVERRLNLMNLTTPSTFSLENHIDFKKVLKTEGSNAVKNGTIVKYKDKNGKDITAVVEDSKSNLAIISYASSINGKSVVKYDLIHLDATTYFDYKFQSPYKYSLYQAKSLNQK